jgi:hypothetical protein
VAIGRACSALTAAWTAMVAAGSMPETAGEAIGASDDARSARLPMGLAAQLHGSHPTVNLAVAYRGLRVVEVQLATYTPRDVKGLYAQALASSCHSSPGIGADEPPLEVVLHADRELVQRSSSRSWLASNASGSPRPCGQTGSAPVHSVP